MPTDYNNCQCSTCKEHRELVSNLRRKLIGQEKVHFAYTVRTGKEIENLQKIIEDLRKQKGA